MLARGNCLTLPFRDAAFDFAFSQYLFEYLANPDLALAEMIRVTRTGGAVVVADVDGLMLFDDPCPPEIARGVRALMDVVARTGFDPHAGRRLYGRFARAGLADVSVRTFPAYAVAGPAPESEVSAWMVRLEALRGPGEEALGSRSEYDAFVEAYRRHLGDSASLKFANLFVVRGTKR